MCGASCFNFQTDMSNCGGCGKACAGDHAVSLRLVRHLFVANASQISLFLSLAVLLWSLYLSQRRDRLLWKMCQSRIRRGKLRRVFQSVPIWTNRRSRTWNRIDPSLLKKLIDITSAFSSSARAELASVPAGQPHARPDAQIFKQT